MANGYGGARVGAGRKLKALVYKGEVTAAERKIVDGLPVLIDKLMELAIEGNLGALKYLVDRILGRVPLLAAAPAADTSIQYVDGDFRHDLVGHLLKARMRKEDRDVIMAEMDLEGTELEDEFEEEDENSELRIVNSEVKRKEEGEEIHSDGQDTRDGQDRVENSEVRIVNSEVVEEEENLTLSSEGRGDQTEVIEERDAAVVATGATRRMGYLPASGRIPARGRQFLGRMGPCLRLLEIAGIRRPGRASGAGADARAGHYSQATSP